MVSRNLLFFFFFYQKEYKEHKFQEGLVKKKLSERRQRSARARKYYDDYAVRNKSRMLNKRSKEEKVTLHFIFDSLALPIVDFYF